MCTLVSYSVALVCDNILMTDMCMATAPHSVCTHSDSLHNIMHFILWSVLHCCGYTEHHSHTIHDVSAYQL